MMPRTWDDDKMLTERRLKQVLRYDPVTGDFWWLERISIRIVVGKKAGVLGSNGHRYIGIDGERFLASRLAWLYMTHRWPTLEIDHRDLDPSNDKWSNLRQATHLQNSYNRRRRLTSKSGLKGVSYISDSGRWFARITVNKVVHHLGCFNTPAAAHAAYRAAAKKMHRSFARLS